MKQGRGKGLERRGGDWTRLRDWVVCGVGVWKGLGSCKGFRILPYRPQVISGILSVLSVASPLYIWGQYSWSLLTMVLPHTLGGQTWHFPTASWGWLEGVQLPVSLCHLSFPRTRFWLHGDQELCGKEEASHTIMGIWWLISSVDCSENEVTSPFAWQLIDEHFLSICRVDVLFHRPSCSWTSSVF